MAQFESHRNQFIGPQQGLKEARSSSLPNVAERVDGAAPSGNCANHKAPKWRPVRSLGQVSCAAGSLPGNCLAHAVRSWPPTWCSTPAAPQVSHVQAERASAMATASAIASSAARLKFLPSQYIRRVADFAFTWTMVTDAVGAAASVYVKAKVEPSWRFWGLSSATRRAESRPSRIGPISFGVKQMGARNAGNPTLRATWRGLETWCGSGPPGPHRRASPRPYR
jgi:hypothetical protein